MTQGGLDAGQHKPQLGWCPNWTWRAGRGDSLDAVREASQLDWLPARCGYHASRWLLLMCRKSQGAWALQRAGTHSWSGEMSAWAHPSILCDPGPQTWLSPTTVSSFWPRPLWPLRVLLLLLGKLSPAPHLPGQLMASRSGLSEGFHSSVPSSERHLRVTLARTPSRPSFLSSSASSISLRSFSL